MKRSTIYLTTILSILLLWLAMLNKRDSLTESQYQIVRVFPFYLLIALGSYCLFALGRGLMFFNDCPHEIPKLEEDIRQAKADLNKKGFNLPVD
mmetsp:Transcript_15695/g.26163  ORF Transcript_15695/g.26163 Transcript_15695/m.26163 type:complete len:94 (+) Transcript_15695:222-503(+)